jgi:hypothetical protein
MDLSMQEMYTPIHTDSNTLDISEQRLEMPMGLRPFYQRKKVKSYFGIYKLFLIIQLLIG